MSVVVAARTAVASIGTAVAATGGVASPQTQVTLLSSVTYGWIERTLFKIVALAFAPYVTSMLPLVTATCVTYLPLVSVASVDIPALTRATGAVPLLRYVSAM